MQHVKDQVSAHFIGLTYDQEHLPIKGKFMSLKKKDLIDFHKRIKESNTRTLLRIKKRNNLSWKQYHSLKKKHRVTYYSVGEYSPSPKFRPHYHVLMFGLHPLTVQALQRNQIWLKGIIHIGTVTSNSVGYVTSYMIDKDNVNDGIREKPFALMSKGIGANYLNEKRKWNKQSGDHPDDYRYYVLVNGFKSRMPRYYKDKIFSKVEKQYLSKIAWDESLELLDKEIERLTEVTGSHIGALQLMEQRKWNMHDQIRSKYNKLKRKI